MSNSEPEFSIKCKVCGNPCQRALIPPYEFVHSDDTIVFKTGGTIVSMGKYTHEANPDYIDIKEAGTMPEPSKTVTRVTNPFGAVRFK